jgi:hypothetical protein
MSYRIGDYVEFKPYHFDKSCIGQIVGYADTEDGHTAYEIHFINEDGESCLSNSYDWNIKCKLNRPKKLELI